MNVELVPCLTPQALVCLVFQLYVLDLDSLSQVFLRVFRISMRPRIASDSSAAEADVDFLALVWGLAQASSDLLPDHLQVLALASHDH